VRVEDTLTLDQCIAIALSRQPAIHAQEFAVAAAQDRQDVARSAFLPQVSFESRYTHLDEPRSVDLGDAFSGDVADTFSSAAAFFQIAQQSGVPAAAAALNNPTVPPFSTARQAAANSIADMRAYMLGENFITSQLLLVQPLWTGGKIRTRYEQSWLGTMAAGQDLARSRQLTAFHVNRAYLSILLAMDLHQVSVDAEGHAHAIERLASSLLEEGDEAIRMADVHRARANRLFYGESTVGLRRTIERAYTKLKLAMGVDQEEPILIAERELPFVEHQLGLSEMLGMALAQRPEIAKAAVGMRVTALDRKAARAEFLPDVALFGGMSTIHDDEDFANPNDTDEWAVGVVGQIPIYTGGRRAAQARRAGHLHAQAHQVYEQAQQLVRQETKEAHLEYREMRERVEAARQSVKSARDALDAFENLFRGDLIAEEDMPQYIEDTLNSRFLLTRSEVKYNQAMFGYNLALARLRLVTASDELPSVSED